LGINKRDYPVGTTICALSLLYAPSRFFADFLRNTDLPDADPRYLGLTPAQYGCIVVLAIGIHFLRKVRRD
jgi:phosphatidylglycerol:prolipoprotein diacylglycerol transferase